jgi:hypothetical protein
MLKTRMVKGVSTCFAAGLSWTKERVPSGHRRPQTAEVCASRPFSLTILGWLQRALRGWGHEV